MKEIPLDGGDEGSQGFPFSAYCCVILQLTKGSKREVKERYT
jgi:hypothetical protein